MEWDGRSRGRAVVASAVLLVAGCSSGGDDTASATSNPDRAGETTTTVAVAPPATVPIAELQQLVDDFLADWGAPGGVIGVALADDDTVFVTSGVADPDGATPITADDLFFVASNTKVFTGALVLRLVERGLVDLDATIDTYLPGWPDGDRVTVRHLLTHTSGYRSWCDDLGSDCINAIVADLTHVFTLDEALEFTRGQPLLFVPGTSVHYSNVNSMLLGKIAESVDGRPLAEQYRSELLDPLALSHTFYAPAEALPVRPDGGLYVIGDSEPQDSGDLPYQAVASMLGPAGGMATTVGDLVRWGRALWRDDSVLEPATLTEATDFTQYGTGLGMLGFSSVKRDFCVFSGCPKRPEYLGPGGSGDVPGTVSTVVYDEALDSVVSVVITSNVNIPAEGFTADVLDLLASGRAD